MNRIRYTMIRVGDLERSIAFYQKLGMQVVRRLDVPDGKFTLAFLEFAEDEGASGVELTYNYGVSTYEHGTAFGQLVIEASDVSGLCDGLRSSGVKILREPGPMKFGKTVIAFVEDPDGYRIELIQHEPAAGHR